MPPLGCTFNEIMRSEQNLCACYAGHKMNEIKPYDRITADQMKTQLSE